MSLSASLPITKLAFSIDVTLVTAPDNWESSAQDNVPEPFVLRIWLAEPSEVGRVIDVVPKPIASKYAVPST